MIGSVNVPGASAADLAALRKIADTARSTATRKGLADNTYFLNPVNQRGLTEYAGAGYTIDRWRLTSDAGRLVVGDEGITFSSTSETAIAVLRQVIDSPSRLHGETVTISALLSDGSLASSTAEVPTSVTAGQTAAVTQAVFDHLTSGHHLALYMSSDGSLLLQFRVPALGELTCVAVKLELGSVQTLAHQDSGGNWVLNEVPDYGEELAKCQRYQIVGKMRGEMITDFRGPDLDLGVGFFVPLPTSLRNSPQIINSDGFVVRSATTTTDTARAATLNSTTLTENGVYLYYYPVAADASERLYLAIAEGSGFDANL